jgi:hypothetical protein
MRVIDNVSLRWEPEEVARDRYPGVPAIVGRDAWITLVDAFESDGDALVAFDSFLIETEARRGDPRVARLFVSHKSSPTDDPYAERIAELATAVGLPYWLDIHNPVLIRVNRKPFTGPQQGILIAAIIEIALLNCRSVIAVHSTLSATSKWIPYEFGRVKTHVPVSRDAAGYFHPAVWNTVAAEYFELAMKTFGEHSAPPSKPTNAWLPVTQWLTDVAKRWGFPPPNTPPSFPLPRPTGPRKLP